jgi:outer membrane immunogenic protein
MKRILIAGAFALALGGPALAADIPPPAPPPPPRAPATYVPTTAPVYNWSGIYIGINGGYAFGDSSWTDTVVPGNATGTFNTNGFLGGGTVGGNIQWGSLVVGAEGDWDWTNLNGTSNNAVCTGNVGLTPSGCETKSDWLGTARGRVGYAFDRILLYGTGGVAFADVEGGPSSGPFESHTQIGWTAGAGLEFAFAPNWTAKVEYLYVDLGNTSCTTNCFGSTGPGGVIFADTTNVKLTENVIRAGINFKFGPWW